MAQVATNLVSRDDAAFPGRAEIALELAAGGHASISDKQPVLGITDQSIGARVDIECEVLAADHDTATIRLAHGVESQDGRSVFEVNHALVSDPSS